MGSTRAFLLEKEPQAFAAATTMFLAACLSLEEAPLPPPISIFLPSLSLSYTHSLSESLSFSFKFSATLTNMVMEQKKEEKERKRLSCRQSSRCKNSANVVHSSPHCYCCCC
ncbi:hypothetical protein TorRG33x02_238320 [Trema orientale]|uniref:Uncharacterized protein n=1 Tax=Trema orientale TaxID=63057 RepID=A0A2P5DY64_TREOI|nr:hypothetical protein TorRG33x02_238320 [Trema orientale]